MNHVEHEDYWADDNFEDSVASAIISVYERKIKNNPGAGPFRLKKKNLSFFRRHGPYIPSSSRFVMFNDQSNNYEQNFDTLNDPLPQEGCMGMRHDHIGVDKDDYKGFFITFYFRKSNIPKVFVPLGKGTPYELTIISSGENGISGEIRYFTVSKDGLIYPCDGQAPYTDMFGRTTIVKQSVVEPHILSGTSCYASVAMQYVADKRFCWTIQAKENTAKATLGCMREEVKSLLYARTLPMTETGRKRPILHLVESHKRRMRNGTDIDITAFLRGTQTVEIGGTLFKVNPPKVDQPRLSKNSNRYY